MATQSDDPKGFYGYLFSDDKTATKTLDALLRAIALYIVRALSWPLLPRTPEDGSLVFLY